MFRARSGVTAAAYAASSVAAWIVAVATYGFTNDHFGRISAARQIARYGELPFRDYFDPGYVLTEFASAALQLLLGDNLLGEILLTTSFMATGAAVVTAVARRIAPSRLSVVLAAVVIILAGPRPYDYDKVLFYPLGVLLCWRYIDRPSVGRLWGLAAGAVVAGMFRYDNGLFTLVAGFVTVVALHGRDLRTSSRQVGVLILASVVCAVPLIVFLQLNGGIADAVDQMVTYAWREGARTRLAQPPSLMRSMPIVSGWDVTWPAAAAANCLYWAFIALPVTATILACRRGALAANRARVLSAATMAVLVAVFILREPLTARIGAAAAPAAIVAVCIWQAAHRQWFARVIATAVILTTAVASGWSTTVLAVTRNLPAVPEMLIRSADSPPPEAFLPKASTSRVIDYVRRCTRPTDRIFAGWFVPELFFFSQRAFAGGMVVAFGHHWSEVTNQRRIIAKMEAESVPIAILQKDDADFRGTYGELHLYLRTYYHAASTTFGGGPEDPVYVVWVRNDAVPVTTDAASAMPCLAAN